MPSPTSNVRVREFATLTPPTKLFTETPIPEATLQLVAQTRAEIREAMSGHNPRLVLIVGPCSIHDPRAALEYAEKLAKLRQEVSNQFIIVMRVYFEKPRTTVGWKGLINDPHLNGTYDIERGLRQARDLLLQINALGLPCATEFLDPIVPQYISDLISWAAIGARTTESQTHREMASGLSMPVGFKNATDGSLDIALNGMLAAQQPHAFLGVTENGQVASVKTTGNPDVHLVLRGGKKPNFQKPHIAFAKASLEPFESPRLIMVDCSHGNSDKDFAKQPLAFSYLTDLVAQQEQSILGMMLESNLVEGNQKMNADLTYGQSITDACVGWETTEALLKETAEKIGRVSLPS